MRLELGRRADYAIRAMVDLARHATDNQRRTARTIAEEMDIPLGYVPQILAELVRAELVTSTSGRDGGYDLAREPTVIDLLEVVQAVDGEVHSTVCVLRGGPCRWDGMCAVHIPWTRAQHAMLEALAGTTLAEVIAIATALDAGCHIVPEGLRSQVSSSRLGVGDPEPERVVTRAAIR